VRQLQPVEQPLLELALPRRRLPLESVLEPRSQLAEGFLEL
jgi:hypothetical protein